MEYYYYKYKHFLFADVITTPISTHKTGLPYDPNALVSSKPAEAEHSFTQILMLCVVTTYLPNKETEVAHMARSTAKAALKGVQKSPKPVSQTVLLEALELAEIAIFTPDQYGDPPELSTIHSAALESAINGKMSEAMSEAAGHPDTCLRAICQLAAFSMTTSDGFEDDPVFKAAVVILKLSRDASAYLFSVCGRFTLLSRPFSLMITFLKHFVTISFHILYPCDRIE